MREKGWEERGPKAHSKNSDFGTPYDLGTLLVSFQLRTPVLFELLFLLPSPDLKFSDLIGERFRGKWFRKGKAT